MLREGQLHFVLLNACSVGNKFSTICGEITDKQLHCCLLTETWHSANSDAALRGCVPLGFTLMDVARGNDQSRRNHGGVAAIV